MPTPEQCYQGGMTTLERYGREHYARITNGRPRRAEYNPERANAARRTPPLRKPSWKGEPQ